MSFYNHTLKYSCHSIVKAENCLSFVKKMWKIMNISSSCAQTFYQNTASYDVKQNAQYNDPTWVQRIGNNFEWQHPPLLPKAACFLCSTYWPAIHSFWIGIFVFIDMNTVDARQLENSQGETAMFSPVMQYMYIIREDLPTFYTSLI